MIDKHIGEVESSLRKINRKQYGDDHERWAAEAGTHLRFVKNAFRNCSAHRHVAFTEDQAKQIFQVSKDFMNHLSIRLSESQE
jgi:hypothetical protein